MLTFFRKNAEDWGLLVFVFVDYGSAFSAVDEVCVFVLNYGWVSTVAIRALHAAFTLSWRDCIQSARARDTDRLCKVNLLRAPSTHNSRLCCPKKSTVYNCLWKRWGEKVTFLVVLACLCFRLVSFDILEAFAYISWEKLVQDHHAMRPAWASSGHWVALELRNKLWIQNTNSGNSGPRNPRKSENAR